MSNLTSEIAYRDKI